MNQQFDYQARLGSQPLAPVPVGSEIDQEVGRLSSSLGLLSATVEELEKRLLPVSVQTSCPIIGQAGPAEARPASPLGESLRESNMRLLATIDRVNATLRGLAI